MVNLCLQYEVELSLMPPTLSNFLRWGRKVGVGQMHAATRFQASCYKHVCSRIKEFQALWRRVLLSPVTFVPLNPKHLFIIIIIWSYAKHLGQQEVSSDCDKLHRFGTGFFSPDVFTLNVPKLVGCEYSQPIQTHLVRQSSGKIVL